MKKLLLFLSTLVLALLQGNAFAESVVHESCLQTGTGVYKAYYENSCDVCGYYDGYLYRGQAKDYWDYFLNNSRREQIFSSTSNGTITPLNGATLTSPGNIELRANWVGSGAGINNTKEVVAFYLENLLFSNNGTSNIIGRLEFNLRGAAVDRTAHPDSRTISMPTGGWNYLSGTELLSINGDYRLNGNYINGPNGSLQIYSGSTYEHKECYIVRGAWCGDGVRNTQESCDPNDASHSGWGNLGCSSSCQPQNSSGGGGGGGGGGGSSCGNGVLNSGEECDLGSGNNNKGACTTSCKKTKCGDGYLQRPNYNAQFEECDYGTSTWPSWCRRSDCRIIGDITTPSSRCISNCDNTTPSDKDGIIFYPAGGALLGNGMKLWDTYSLSSPYIKNNTGYDLFIDKKLCVYKENKLSLQGNSSICSTSQIGELSAGEKFDFNIADYTANTALIPSGLSYQDVNIITAPQGLQNSYLSSVLTVRVAKPTVANVYGGTSLLNFNASLYSDVEALSQNFLNDLRNKNFVVASIADTAGKAFSSYVSSVGDRTTYDNSVNNWNTSTNSSISKVSKTGYITDINTLPTQKYNGLQNVFIHKGNVSLNGQSISGNKTFIIEGGDLIINGSIDAAADSNIAFIIKGGNLIVGQNVVKLDGVYLAIKQDTIGGKINSDGTSTNNRLVVNGGLYGDARDLLANRTYMKSDNGIINVGTTINFRSGVFKNPPPLLTTFIDEYMKVNKIAK